ncbi:hypothetical protein DSUL_140033 [Desulfovibrionales bacterium]
MTKKTLPSIGCLQPKKLETNQLTYLFTSQTASFSLRFIPIGSILFVKLTSPYSVFKVMTKNNR